MSDNQPVHESWTPISRKYHKAEVAFHCVRGSCLDVLLFQTSDNLLVHESWTVISGKDHEAEEVFDDAMVPKSGKDHKVFHLWEVFLIGPSRSGVPLWEGFLIGCSSFSNV